MRRAGPILILVIGVLALLVSLLPLPMPAGAGGESRILETKLGLDLRGGLRIEYQVLPTDGKAPGAADLEVMRKIIVNRIDKSGVSEPQVVIQGNDRIIVEMPGVQNADQIRNLAWHLALPVTTLTLAYLADYTLIMRSSLLDELGEDYLITARAKGLRDVEVRNRHGVRNALLPTTTLVAISLGYVVSGAITIETVFSIPGLGLLAVEATELPDYWVLQGCFLIASAGVIFANLVANLLYGVLDPRVRT